VSPVNCGSAAKAAVARRIKLVRQSLVGFITG
jgi:hypothetical protein